MNKNIDFESDLEEDLEPDELEFRDKVRVRKLKQQRRSLKKDSQGTKTKEKDDTKKKTRIDR